MYIESKNNSGKDAEFQIPTYPDSFSKFLPHSIQNFTPESPKNFAPPKQFHPS